MNIEIKPEEFTVEFFNTIKKLSETQPDIYIRIGPQHTQQAAQVLNKLQQTPIQLLVVDIDGVLTDAGVYVSDSDAELKKFNAKDGYGMIQFLKTGKQIAFLSSGKNVRIIEKRAQMLGVQHVVTGTWDKITKLNHLSAQLGIGFENIAYIGDDLNDEQVMRAVGFSACPADAAPEIKRLANLVLQKKGGEGCVREFLDLYKTEN